MKWREACVEAVLLAGLAAVCMAAGPPVAVSPGDASKLVGVEARCPTFSWGAAVEAESYELVVYRLSEGGAETDPALRRIFPGSVHSWTPSLGSCLERGGRYAWSVRAVGQGKASEWSRPSLFQIGARPSEAELEAAAEVVRSYLASESAPVVEAGGTPSYSAPIASSPAADEVSIPVSRTHVSDNSSILVDGVVVETKAEAPCSPFSTPAVDLNDRFIDCGNGTVHDTVTGLLWLKDPGCLSGYVWGTAVQVPSTISHGECGLSDHSQRGDWRLPTESDWQTILAPGCGGSPKLVGKSGGCFASAGNAWAVGVGATNYWSATTDASLPSNAWRANVTTGNLGSSAKTAEGFLWLVRSGG